MTSNPNKLPQPSLTETLESALAQCHEQVRLLEDKSRTVEKLQAENERLRYELEHVRAEVSQNQYDDNTTKFQELFEQNVAKQAEIDLLKHKLRTVKHKARQRGLVEPISSSSAPPSRTGSVASSPSFQTHSSTPFTIDRNAQLSAIDRTPSLQTPSLLPPPRKRPRSLSPAARPPLLEKSANITTVPAKAKQEKESLAKRHHSHERTISVIPEVAEDGENYLTGGKTKARPEGRSRSFQYAVNQRLDNLLEQPGRSSTLLSKVESRRSPTKGSISGNSTPGRIKSSISGPPTPATSSIKSSRPAVRPGPEDEEPFRARPMSRLALSHFKPNPATNSGLDYVYDQVVRGQERRCLPGCTRECCATTFGALAATLPSFQSTHPQVTSDDALLRNFLGPDSEARIKQLTPAARQNLIHEARTKLVADTYGKMHRSAYERGRSPPGFWRTDMPLSQEERDDRERAKRLERDEVKRRYDEALRDGGRWVFADE